MYSSVKGYQIHRKVLNALYLRTFSCIIKLVETFKEL